MIRVHNLWKSFGNQVLFDGVTFSISEGEKVGLIGRNGYGKSTLLKMLQGVVEPDEGEVVVLKDKTVSALDQHIHFTESTVRKEACLGLPEGEREFEWLAAKMLHGLGFSEEDQQKDPRIFSGGYQVRINLVKALLARPDILFLDEPTNFLDIVSLRWFEQFLNQWKGTVVLVTHDQTFMDRVTTHTMGIHRQGIRKIKGSTKDLRAQIALEEDIHERTRKNQQKKDAKTEKFIREFRAGARSAGLVQSRIKMLNKVKKLEKLAPIPPVEFRFQDEPFFGDRLLQGTSLKFGYSPDELLLDGVSITLEPGDRIGVVGPNGRGKSTFLKVLSEDETLLSGSLKRHMSANIGYFRQMNRGLEDGERTIYEEIRATSPNYITEQQIHTLCGSLMFEGDKRYKHMKVLSGGERSRVELGKLMLQPHNALFLDEPTNHLDMESCEALGDALDAYEGAIVCVTHDEALLRRFAKRLVVFDGGKVFLFQGTYDAFLDEKGWVEEKTELQKAPEEVVIDVSKKLSQKEKYKLKKEREKEMRPIERAMKASEEEILKREASLLRLKDALEESKRKSQKLRIQDYMVKIEDEERAIARAFHELEHWDQERQKCEALWEEKVPEGL